MTRRLALAALALASGFAARDASAQPGATARLYVFADTVDAGQRVVVAVAIDHAPGVQAFFPEPPLVFPEAAPALAFGDAEPLAVHRLVPTARGGVRTDSALYETAVFAVDAARIGPVEVRLVADGDTSVVRTGVAVIPVRVRAQATGAPPPPGEPWPFPSPLPHVVGLGALVLALVGAGLWRWRRRGRRVTETPPRLAPYPEAVARLDVLDAAHPATAADAEALADALKDVVRVYVARRVGVPARTRTTDELSDALARVPWLGGDARRRVRGLLRVADLVDFAAWRLSADALAEARAAARAAVEAVEADARAHESPAPEPADA